jgi:rod shape-determining protein MreD
MTSVTVRPLNPVAWLGAPAFACAVASLAFALPFSLFGLRLPEPVFAFVPAFSWAIIRPSVLPPFVLLLLGLYLDLLWGGPLGLWPVCLLAAYAPVLFGRAFLSGMGFWSLWGWYIVTCAAALAIGWLLVDIKAGAAPNLIALGGQFLATGALFPFAFGLIERYEDADVRFR